MLPSAENLMSKVFKGNEYNSRGDNSFKMTLIPIFTGFFSKRDESGSQGEILSFPGEKVLYSFMTFSQLIICSLQDIKVNKI